MRRRALALFACFAGACSSSADSVAGPGPSATATVIDAHPPSNLNVTLCAPITGAADPAKVTECSTCCVSGGYGASNFAYNDHCTCGKAKDGSGATVCATQTASADVCATCCDAASFLSYGWVGSDGDAGSGTCTCDSQFDDVTCAPSATGDACTVCCLNLGYLGSMYTALGATSCSCRN